MTQQSSDRGARTVSNVTVVSWTTPPGASALIDLRLLHPVAHRLLADAALLGDPAHRSSSFTLFGGPTAIRKARSRSSRG
jgi:hypothetical protein